LAPGALLDDAPTVGAAGVVEPGEPATEPPPLAELTEGPTGFVPEGALDAPVAAGADPESVDPPPSLLPLGPPLLWPLG
jgi:hypothetical protein